MDPNEALPDVGIEDLASDASGEFLENRKVQKVCAHKLPAV